MTMTPDLPIAVQGRVLGMEAPTDGGDYCYTRRVVTEPVKQALSAPMECCSRNGWIP